MKTRIDDTRRKKILIIKLGAIGDVLMATPFFEAIRKKYPRAKISLLIGNWSKDVVRNNPNIDEVISIDENIFWKKKVVPLSKLFLKLKFRRFDIVYVMHWSNLFNFFAFCLGAKERIGFDRFGKGKFLTKKVPFTEGEKGSYMAQKYLNLLTEEFKKYDTQMKIYLTHDEIKFAKDEFERLQLTSKGKVIGIAPGGGENPKIKMLIRRWPPEYFSILIDKIHTQLNLPIVLFGGKSDLSVSEKIISLTSKKGEIISFVNKTTIRETSALMSLCSVIITNDSGLLHLAISVNTPTVSIFGPTAPYDKVPLSEKHQFLYKYLQCSPCYKYGKFPNCRTLECLKSITPEEVFNKVKELI